jgi:hypothetical protein
MRRTTWTWASTSVSDEKTPLVGVSSLSLSSVPRCEKNGLLCDYSFTCEWACVPPIILAAIFRSIDCRHGPAAVKRKPFL